jgi:mRNA-degrading endonuclease RelE of RelBE toxin-antitoxin system
LITFEELEEFNKDLKKLSKKYKTLIEDIEVVKKVLKVNPEVRPPFSFRISNLGIDSCIIKVKKIASRSFKGKGVQSGFRLIYAHFENENKIVLIELFHKSQKILEDRDRILKHFI